MADTLRVMFYDKSDWAGRMLNSSWFAGGLLYKMFRRLDVCVGVESWEEAFEFLAKVEPDKKISMVQFWGHGSQGKVFINGEYLGKQVVRTSHEHHANALKLKERLTEDATIWLRCCSIFAGSRGHTFAESWSKFFDCTIAAHTFIIGPWQSGLHTIKPDQKPYWSLREGIDENGKNIWSKYRKPNTIFCLRGTIPKGW